MGVLPSIFDLLLVPEVIESATLGVWDLSSSLLEITDISSSSSLSWDHPKLSVISWGLLTSRQGSSCSDEEDLGVEEGN